MSEGKFSQAQSKLRIERIKAALLAREMTADELADTVHIHRSYAREYIKHLREQWLLHIVGYSAVKDRHLWHKPIYAWGAGADAPPPKKLTNSQRAKMRRADPEKRLQDAMKARAKNIKPHRDWSAAWIPTRSAA